MVHVLDQCASIHHVWRACWTASALSMAQFLCCAYVCMFCLIFCGQRFLHSDDGYVHATTLFSARALAQAHPTMSCIHLVPRTDGRSCNHFHTCGSLPSAVRVFQQALTVESNSWTTPLVLHLPSLVNVLARHCWNGSMLIVFGNFILTCFYNRTREGDWSVTVVMTLESLGAKPSIARAGLLSNLTG